MQNTPAIVSAFLLIFLFLNDSAVYILFHAMKLPIHSLFLTTLFNTTHLKMQLKTKVTQRESHKTKISNFTPYG